ncbi:MAG TPA: hypothetical protein VGI82_09100 [Chitinophagaceae bacterium]
MTVFILDFIIGGLLKAFYFRQTSGLEYRTTYSMEKARADMLIFGSSTAIHDYIPETFEKKLSLSAYNVGRDGISIFYDYAVLRAVLKRYIPKIIILDFEKQEFSKNQLSYDRLAALLPYYKRHPEIDSIVNLRSSFEKYKFISSIYPYNSLLFTISAGNSEFNKKRSEDINGFVPINHTWTDPIREDNSFLHDEIDSNKVKVYESFIKECLRAKIELYIVCSPLFVKPGYINNTIVMGKEIAAKYRIKFFDCSQDANILGRPKLFADIAHLNETGATIYSGEIADKILGIKRSIPDTK